MSSVTISPGDVRTFKRGDGNAVVVGLGLWAERRGRWIDIHLTGPNHSHTTVTNNPDSERFHRTLFRNLRSTLVESQCWPFGEEGAAEGEPVDAAAHFRPVPIRGKPISETILEDRGE